MLMPVARIYAFTNSAEDQDVRKILEIEKYTWMFALGSFPPGQLFLKVIK